MSVISLSSNVKHSPKLRVFQFLFECTGLLVIKHLFTNLQVRFPLILTFFRMAYTVLALYFITRSVSDIMLM